MRRRALALLGALALVALSAPAGAQEADAVRLPTYLDAIALAPGADQFLLGNDFNERAFPGRVHDVERVQVELAPDGSPSRVTVDQRLNLEGLGDFSLRIPGPAVTVEALPSSDSRPGLRRGSMIWQGFSPGTRKLHARIELYPEREAPRLPLGLTFEVAVDGVPLEPGDSASGSFTAVLRIENVTAIPTRIGGGDADPEAAAEGLDAIRAALHANRRPVPGVEGVPMTIPASNVTTRTEDVEAPIRINGVVAFTATRFTADVEGGAVSKGSGAPSLVRFAALLGGGRPLAHEVRIRGTALNLELSGVEVEAGPAPPHPVLVRPPGGFDSWSEAVADGAASGREVLATAMSAMWRVARLRLYDGYIGNPDPIGSASSVYTFRLAPPPPPPVVVPPPPPRELGTFGMALAGFAGIALLFVLALQWAHA